MESVGSLDKTLSIGRGVVLDKYTKKTQSLGGPQSNHGY